MYGDYSFYEFLNGEFEYYALIYAKTGEDAAKCYEEEVCEVEPETYPEKLPFTDGIKRIMQASCEDGEDDNSELYYLLRDLFVKDKPQVVLISKDLI